MTTRRSVLGGVLGLAVLGGGCERPAAHGLPDTVLASGRDGLLRISGAGVQRLGPAELSHDGRVVFAADGTSLRRLDPSDGRSLRSTPIGGGWIPRAVSADGRACALARTAAAVRPVARARTVLLIVTESGSQEWGSQELDLPGVLEPDAFTADGTGLFVLEWLPAAAPDHYRVRLLDLASRRVEPLLTRDKVPVPVGAEEEMSGEGRSAVLSADRSMLYTLYTHQPGHRHTRELIAGTSSGVHAFVHVLHLTERWAYCVDLPHPFGEGPAAGHALAADGQHIAVADLNSGSLAYAGASSLHIEQIVRVPAATGSASLVLTPDRRVLAAAGTTVTVLDRGSGAATGTWSLPSPVRGLALSSDGARLYAGGDNEVAELDAATGKRVGRAAADGLIALRHVV